MSCICLKSPLTFFLPLGLINMDVGGNPMTGKPNTEAPTTPNPNTVKPTTSNPNTDKPGTGQICF